MIAACIVDEDNCEKSLDGNMFSKKGSKKSNKVEPKRTKMKPADIFEPFQEAVDEAMEMDWLELENQSIPLENLGVDKSTASQAVAFVIRASRRGVVSLCAEVADILKDKNRLESEIEEQKEEIAELLRNQVLPRSPSPPPPETRDFSLQTVQEAECQTMSLTESSIQTETIYLTCSKVHSLDENNKLEVRSTRLKGVEFDCGSDYTVQCTCPKMITTSTQNPVLTSTGMNTDGGSKLHSEHGYFEHQNLDAHLKTLEGKNKTLKSEAKKRDNATTKLEVELSTAKQEIVSLQKAIRDMQTKEYDKLKEEERLNMEETYSVDVQNNEKVSDDTISDGELNENGLNIIVNEGKRKGKIISVPSGQASVSVRSSIFPGPILGCKCRMCAAFFRSTGLLGFASTPYVTNSSGRNPVLKDMRKLVSLQNSQLRIHPNDKVLLQNRKTGTVRYVGHLDGAGVSSVVYAGIELADARGQHDGYLFGKRYFFAPQNHGLFLPLQDILCVFNDKVDSPSLIQQRQSTGKNKKQSRRSNKFAESYESSSKAFPDILSTSSNASSKNKKSSLSLTAS